MKEFLRYQIKGVKTPLILLGFSFLGIFSCEKNAEFIFSTKHALGQEHYSLEMKPIEIKMDSLSLNYYSKAAILRTDNTHYLVGYNTNVHSLDFFDLQSRSFSNRIALIKDGPNATSRVRQLYPHNLDSIFIFDSSGMYKLIDSNGLVQQVYGFDNKEDSSHDLLYGAPMSVGESRFYFNKALNELLFHVKPFVAKGNRDVLREEGNFDKPILAALNISTGNLRTLPIYYSEYAKKFNDQFSSDLVPNITFSDDRVLLNYVFESNVYEYVYSEGLNYFGGASDFNDDLVEPYDLASKPMEHYLITESRYGSIHFDPNSKLYYRVSWNKQNLKQSDGRFNSLLTKPASLTIWKSDYSVIYDSLLDRNLVIPDASLFDEDLLLWGDPTKYNKESEFTIYALKVSK